MSWATFSIIASGLVTLIFLLVALPWIRHRQVHERDVLSNIQIVKQRLAELDREVAEGLISVQDKQKASDELKLAMVDEASDERTASRRSALVPLFVGALIAITTGGIVYSSVNHIPQVQQADAAIKALPELSDKLASGDTGSFSTQDVANLAFAIRQRLRDAPDDATGWMFLGRLWLSAGEDEQSVQAVEKALAIAPEDSTTRIIYAQALMATDNTQRLTLAQRVLQGLVNERPDNDNLALMMAVVSARLGDLANTQKYFSQIQAQLPAQHETRLALEERIAELSTQQNSAPSTGKQAVASTGFNLTIRVSEDLMSEIPEKGYLIVYAQDSLSDNRMPAAVVKMQLQNFPVTLSLTSDNAMMPSFTIASLNQARLIARISSDEDVMPAPGDLLGELTVPVAPGEVLPQSIEINKELK